MDNFGSKQSAEAYYVAFDFCNVLGEGDTVASATVTAADPTTSPTDVTSTILDAAKQNIDGTMVNVWVRAGTSGKTYTITCRVVTTTAGETFELEAGLPVADV